MIDQWADLAVLMADFGVVAEAAGRQTRGMLDSADEMLLQGGAPVGVIGTQRLLTIATGSLTLQPGSSVKVAGTTYVVRELYQLDDGLLTRLHLSTA